jgi:hypothetical protein
VKKYINKNNFFLEIYLQKRKYLNQYKKVSTTITNSLFIFYQIQIKLPFYIHKIFIVIEIQLNSILLRTKLVPYLFTAIQLCFYSIIFVNKRIINNPHYVISIFDSIQLPLQLYNIFHHRDYQIQYLPAKFKILLKKYWYFFNRYIYNKIWLLTNYLLSPILAEVLIFDYPNIINYIEPFKRFTNFFLYNRPDFITGKPERALTNVYNILQLKLFEYGIFYVKLK